MSGVSTLLLDADIGRSMGQAAIWGLRMGLIVGWVVNGIFVWTADRDRFAPYPAMGLAGWLAFEWAASEAPPLGDGLDVASSASAVSYALRANMAVMAGFMLVSASTSGCSPLEPQGAMQCFERAEVQYSLSWRSGFARLMSRSVNLLADLVHRRYHGDDPRTWQLLLAPVMHLGRITGGGAGVQFTL